MKRYSIPISTILYFLIFMVSLYFTLQGYRNLTDFTNAKDLNSILAKDVEPGKYYYFDADSFLINDQSQSGVSESKSELLKTYEVYHFKTANNKYLKTYVALRKTLRELSNFSEGHGQCIRITGKAMPSTQDNADWLKHVNEYRPGMLYTNICIVEDSYESLRNSFSTKMGIMILSLFAILWNRYFVFRDIVSVYSYDPHFKHVYYIDDEIEQLEKRYKLLESKISDFRRWALIGLLFFVTGLSIILVFEFDFTKILGLLLLLFGLWLMYEYFINSDNLISKSFASLFNIEALPQKKEALQIKIRKAKQIKQCRMSGR